MTSLAIAANGLRKSYGDKVETLRGLLLGTEIGHNGWLAVAKVPGARSARIPLVDCLVQA
jgi:hypothetical protein